MHLKSENLKYCICLLDVIQETLKKRFKKFLQFEPSANDAILASVSKERKEYVKELVLTETRKINRSEKLNSEALDNR